MSAEAGSRLADLGAVSEDYRHHPKLITPGEDLVLPEAYLKWYDIRRAETSIPEEIDTEAHAFLRGEVGAGRLSLDGDLGFIVNHLSGDSVYLLMVFTWRNDNEMWESVYAKDVSAGGPFRPVPQGTHKGVICVWEFGAVAHEHEAWTRFLYSERDENAKRVYLADRFSGTV